MGSAGLACGSVVEFDRGLIVGAQSTPAEFTLELKRQTIGKAQYQFIPKTAGFGVTAAYSHIDPQVVKIIVEWINGFE